MDRYLDTTRIGPMNLRREDIAPIVVNCLRRGVELGHYDLRAWVVMANHVHVLLLPKVSPQRLLGGLKGSTAREANQVLGRTGRPFWHAESNDHRVRDARELEKTVAYIENCRWSSAAGTSGGTSGRATSTSGELAHTPHA